MKIHKGISALALSAVVLGMSVSAPAYAKGKSVDCLKTPKMCEPGRGSVARNKTGWIVPTIAGLAVAGGILAVSGGKSKPASP